MELPSLEELIKKDSEVLLHPASSIAALIDNGPTMITRGKGCYIYDAEGKQLLDAVAGLWCVNVGYGRAALAQVMKEATEQLAYYHTFSNASNPWQVMLAEKILQHAPSTLSKVFFGCTGSDANDTAIKIAWHYHSLRGKRSKVKVIAREQAYHGTSTSTAGLTGLGSFHREYPLPMDFVLRTECPHFYTRGHEGESEEAFCERLINHVADIIEREGEDNIAAFIAEPIHGAGGIIEPPRNYYPRLQALLREKDILMIADEVVCGFGRLGTWFGSELLAIEPDILCGAKGLTSGYFPLSMTAISEELWQVLKQGSETLGGFYHGYTYSGHPVGAAVALANLHIIEQEGLVERARAQGAYLHHQLNKVIATHPMVGEIRGRGLLAGIQLVQDKTARQLPDPSLKWPLKLAARVREEGVIVRPLPSVGSIAVSPPLIFSTNEIDQLVAALKLALDSL